MTRMASGVRFSEKRSASSDSGPVPSSGPAEFWPLAAGRGVAHVARAPARTGEAWRGERGGAGGCVLLGPGTRPRRPGGLLSVAEGQELERGAAGRSGGFLFFSAAATGGAQGLRGGDRAPAPPELGAGGGLGWKGMAWPSGRGSAGRCEEGGSERARRPPQSAAARPAHPPAGSPRVSSRLTSPCQARTRSRLLGLGVRRSRRSQGLCGPWRSAGSCRLRGESGCCRTRRVGPGGDWRRRSRRSGGHGVPSPWPRPPFVTTKW